MITSRLIESTLALALIRALSAAWRFPLTMPASTHKARILANTPHTAIRQTEPGSGWACCAPAGVHRCHSPETTGRLASPSSSGKAGGPRWYYWDSRSGTSWKRRPGRYSVGRLYHNSCGCVYTKTAGPAPGRYAGRYGRPERPFRGRIGRRIWRYVVFFLASGKIQKNMK